MKTLFCLFLSLSLFAQNPNPSATLDAAIQSEMSTKHFPGVSTIIVKNGEIVWVESYGYADVANSVEVEDTTVFLLASVSKLFAGTATMQLHENGTINLDADVNNYLPWTTCSKFHRRLHYCTPTNDAHFIHKDNHNEFFLWVSRPLFLCQVAWKLFSTTGSTYNASRIFTMCSGTSSHYSNMGLHLMDIW